ncbi:SprT family zinc-dependent metalloprotease [Cognatishimia sp. WU-CL00825]|uniref:M48 family metallopeptidase n=1 Tax=Cognatishimia sp. WU-CL00825 TaxID=3127658 RepID=UPI00310559B3
MAQHILPSEPDIAVSLRRSARAKRISLRVSRLDGCVTLTVPKRISDAEALDFAQSKVSWLRRQLADRPQPVLVGFGSEIPFQGSLLTIAPSAGHGMGRGVQLRDETLFVPGSPESAGVKALGFFKQQARQRLVAAVDRYGAALGQPYSRFTLRDTRSRWGSCSSEGALMFSWRLILAPSEVLDYVAAHEVAHLAQMNHSPAFWAVVEQLFGPHQAERNWLRRHGEKLHQYRFRAG